MRGWEFEREDGFLIPERKLAEELGRAYYLSVYAPDYLEKGKRVLEVLEIRCPDPEFWRWNEPFEFLDLIDKALFMCAYLKMKNIEIPSEPPSDLKKMSYTFNKKEIEDLFFEVFSGDRNFRYGMEFLKDKAKERKKAEVVIRKLDTLTSSEEPLIINRKEIAYIRHAGTVKGETGKELFFWKPPKQRFQDIEGSLGIYGISRLLSYTYKAFGGAERGGYAGGIALSILQVPEAFNLEV